MLVRAWCGYAAAVAAAAAATAAAVAATAAVEAAKMNASSGYLHLLCAVLVAVTAVLDTQGEPSW